MCNHRHRIKETNRIAQVGDITTKWIFCFVPKKKATQCQFFPCRINERRCDILGLEYSVWWHKYGVRCHKIQCPEQLTKQSCDQVHKSVVARQCTCGCDECSTRVCHVRWLRAGVMEGRIFVEALRSNEGWSLTGLWRLLRQIHPDQGIFVETFRRKKGTQWVCIIRREMGRRPRWLCGEIKQSNIRRMPNKLLMSRHSWDVLNGAVTTESREDARLRDQIVLPHQVFPVIDDWRVRNQVAARSIAVHVRTACKCVKLGSNACHVKCLRVVPRTFSLWGNDGWLVTSFRFQGLNV